MSKQGFTLIELLVTIVISAIVVGIAGQAFLDATRLRIRTATLLESTTGTADVISYLEEDTRRIGAKAYMIPVSSVAAGSSSSSAGLTKLGAIYIDPTAASPDSSSFIPGYGVSGSNRLDSLTFRYGVYNTAGAITGYQEVLYAVNSSHNLVRSVRAFKDLNLVDITPLPPDLIMATNVIGFKTRYGVYAQDTIVFGPMPLVDPPVDGKADLKQLGSVPVIARASESNIPEVTGFTAGTVDSFEVVKNAARVHLDIPLTQGATYRVKFGLGSNYIASTNFRNDSDLIAVSIRSNTNLSHLVDGTSEYQFYSALDTVTLGRSFDFSPLNADNATLVFRFKTRTNIAMSGASFRIDSVCVYRKTFNGYSWQDANYFTGTNAVKKNYVRALELSISVQTKNAVSSITRVIPLVNNGV